MTFFKANQSILLSLNSLTSQKKNDLRKPCFLGQIFALIRFEQKNGQAISNTAKENLNRFGERVRGQKNKKI